MSIHLTEKYSFMSKYYSPRPHRLQITLISVQKQKRNWFQYVSVSIGEYKWESSCQPKAYQVSRNAITFTKHTEKEQ